MLGPSDLEEPLRCKRFIFDVMSHLLYLLALPIAVWESDSSLLAQELLLDQMPAFFLSRSALSVLSQVKSGSSLPKWPNAAVRL